MAARGGQSKFTKVLASRICKRLADGETLRAVCRVEGMPSPQTVLRWTRAHDAFSEQYAKARETGYHLMADELVEIADDGRNDSYQDEDGNVRVNTDVVARSRLRVDTRKWLLSKALPKIYGDKLAHVGGDESDKPIRAIVEIRRTIVDARDGSQ